MISSDQVIGCAWLKLATKPPAGNDNNQGLCMKNYRLQTIRDAQVARRYHTPNVTDYCINLLLTPSSHHPLQLLQILRLCLVLSCKRAGDSGGCHEDFLSDRFGESVLVRIEIILEHFEGFVSGRAAIHEDVDRH